MYGSVLDGWLGGGGSTIVNGPFEISAVPQAARWARRGAARRPDA
jgi:hypothetical protein